MPSDLDRSISSLSINSADSQPEDDWDRSLVEVAPLEVPAVASTTPVIAQLSSTTPRNSVVFPVEGTPGRTTSYSSTGLSTPTDSVNAFEGGGYNKKRTLSDLLKLHSEKGSVAEFSQEEATRIADVLGQWINASSSPYEVEDDFFTRHAQDDINLNSAVAARRASGIQAELAGRPRGKSESLKSTTTHVGSRPSSALGTTAA